MNLRKIICRLLSCVVFIFIITETNAAIINVPQDYASIQSAVNVAQSGDEIHVAAGTYNESLSITTSDSGIALVGGYDNDYTEPPNPDLNVTIIRGVGGSVISIINVTGITIKGFTITGGRSTNTSGGGIFTYNSTVTIEKNKITNNSCPPPIDGGGIACYRGTPTIRNNVITENSSIWGGGVSLVWTTNAILERNVIKNNLADFRPDLNDTDTWLGWGGGVALAACYGTTKLINNIISGNKSIWDGGGIQANRVNLDVINNTIIDNFCAYNPKDFGCTCNYGIGCACNYGNGGAGIAAEDNAYVRVVNTILKNYQNEFHIRSSSRVYMTHTVIEWTGVPLPEDPEDPIPDEYWEWVGFWEIGPEEEDWLALYRPNPDVRGAAIGGEEAFLNGIDSNYHLTANSPMANIGANNATELDPVFRLPTAVTIPSDDIDYEERALTTEDPCDIGADELGGIDLEVEGVENETEASTIAHPEYGGHILVNDDTDDLDPGPDYGDDIRTIILNPPTGLTPGEILKDDDILECKFTGSAKGEVKLILKQPYDANYPKTYINLFDVQGTDLFHQGNVSITGDSIIRWVIIPIEPGILLPEQYRTGSDPNENDLKIEFYMEAKETSAVRNDIELKSEFRNETTLALPEPYEKNPDEEDIVDLTIQKVEYVWRPNPFVFHEPLDYIPMLNAGILDYLIENGVGSGAQVPQGSGFETSGLQDPFNLEVNLQNGLNENEIDTINAVIASNATGSKLKVKLTETAANSNDFWDENHTVGIILAEEQENLITTENVSKNKKAKKKNKKKKREQNKIKAFVICSWIGLGMYEEELYSKGKGKKAKYKSEHLKMKLEIKTNLSDTFRDDIKIKIKSNINKKKIKAELSETENNSLIFTNVDNTLTVKLSRITGLNPDKLDDLTVEVTSEELGLENKKIDGMETDYESWKFSSEMIKKVDNVNRQSLALAQGPEEIIINQAQPANPSGNQVPYTPPRESHFRVKVQDRSIPQGTNTITNKLSILDENLTVPPIDSKNIDFNRITFPPDPSINYFLSDKNIFVIEGKRSLEGPLPASIADDAIFLCENKEEENKIGDLEVHERHGGGEILKVDMIIKKPETQNEDEPELEENKETNPGLYLLLNNNNDDDATDGNDTDPDNTDNKVNGTDDEKDMADLSIKKLDTKLVNMTGGGIVKLRQIRGEDGGNIRIFEKNPNYGQGNQPEWREFLKKMNQNQNQKATSNFYNDLTGSQDKKLLVEGVDPGELWLVLEFRKDGVSYQDVIKIIVIGVDLDLDSNMDGDPDNDDSIEMNLKGIVVNVNNDSDVAGNGIDNQNGTIDGAADKAELTSLFLRKIDYIPTGYKIVLKVSDKTRLRIFDETDTARIGPPVADGGPNTDEYEVPIEKIKAGELKYFIEGFNVGLTGDKPDHVVISLEVRDGANAVITKDEVRCVINVDRKPWDAASQTNPSLRNYIKMSKLTNASEGDPVFLRGIAAEFESQAIPVTFWGKQRKDTQVGLNIAIATTDANSWIQTGMGIIKKVNGTTVPQIFFEAVADYASSKLPDTDPGYDPDGYQISVATTSTWTSGKFMVEKMGSPSKHVIAYFNESILGPGSGILSHDKFETLIFRVYDVTSEMAMSITRTSGTLANPAKIFNIKVENDNNSVWVNTNYAKDDLFIIFHDGKQRHELSPAAGSSEVSLFEYNGGWITKNSLKMWDNREY